MPQVRLRIRHSATGAEETIANESFVEGEVERIASLEARLQTVGELTVSVEVPALLGVVRKRLPMGRHRATVEVLRGDTWVPLIDGTLTNERAAHGRVWPGGVRRWSLTLVDDAVDVVWGRLDGVQLRPAAEATELATGRFDMQWVEASGAGLAVVQHTAWGIDALTALAFTAAGLQPLAGAPTAFSRMLPGVVPTVALCAPRPEVGGVVGYRNVPNWTGGQLLELRCEAEQLVLEASYAAWPGAEIGAVVLRSTADPLPAPGAPEFAALVTLDDDGYGVPWHDEYDWSTEPGDVDGVALDDFALTYMGGPDGGFIGQTDVLDLPLQATYAARSVALSGTRAPGRDGGRTVENKQKIELPLLLAPVQAASAAGSVFETVTVGGYSVDVARPVYDVASDEPNEKAVYLVSLVDRGGQWRAVAERRGASGRAACETWARELFPSLAYAIGDAEVVALAVPAEAVPEGAVRLGDALAGVVFEGLAWVVRAITRREDSHEVELSLARPAGAESAAEGGGGNAGTGRVELPPAIVAVATQYLESDQSGTEYYYVDQVRVDAAVPDEADTPAGGGFEIEIKDSADAWVRVYPQVVRQKSVTFENASKGRLTTPDAPAPANPFEGQAWRARVRYPSGTVTSWTETTAT